ncbi:hypothetical protein [Streptomyces sviceus]|uniref:hypothetical protein n=1 Tax=Streptomyces sviceus TaxID=285530 RepID=UPI003330B0F1
MPVETSPVHDLCALGEDSTTACTYLMREDLITGTAESSHHGIQCLAGRRKVRGRRITRNTPELRHPQYY